MRSAPHTRGPHACRWRRDQGERKGRRDRAGRVGNIAEVVLERSHTNHHLAIPRNSTRPGPQAPTTIALDPIDAEKGVPRCNAGGPQDPPSNRVDAEKGRPLLNAGGPHDPPAHRINAEKGVLLINAGGPQDPPASRIVAEKGLPLSNAGATQDPTASRRNALARQNGPRMTHGDEKARQHGRPRMTHGGERGVGGSWPCVPVERTPLPVPAAPLWLRPSAPCRAVASTKRAWRTSTGAVALKPQ